MRTASVAIYQFGELSEAGKEVARNGYRANGMDYQWYDCVYEEAANIADILGIDIRTRKVSFRDSTTRYDGINIGFTGFSSQGDGAHFQGSYSYAKGAPKAIREYAPLDTVLHRFADKLQALQKKNFYGIQASVVHRGHYSHEYCTLIDVSMKDDRYGNQRYPSCTVEEDVTVILRDFMRWIYIALEKEHDFQMSDESVEGQLTNSNIEFTEAGKRTVYIGATM